MTPAPDSVELAEEASTWTSAYVHFPFCRRVCPYCDFAVVADRSESIDRYVQAVTREIGESEPAGRLDAVFFGGGTPSHVGAEVLKLVLDALAKTHGLASDAEVSMEANPEDVSTDAADRFVQAGFTRLSLGIQSFDPAVLRRLGRQHTPAQAAGALEAGTRAGFTSVSADLIFGEPSETLASWRESVVRALDAGVDHLSTYALTVERGTALSRAVREGAPAPDEDDQADKWLMAEQLASSAGLIRYEVSNAARPGHVCRYNLATWGQADYLAFGMGAHGHRAGVRTRNVRSLDAYLRAVEASGSAVRATDTLSAWEQETERVMLGLRRRVGVVVGTAGRRLIESEAGRRLVAAGVLASDGHRMWIADPLLTDMVVREVVDLAES